MKRIFLWLVISAFASISVYSQKLSENWEKPPEQHEIHPSCAIDGDGGDRELNLAKNRIDEPSFYHAVAFKEVRNLHSADAASEKDRVSLNANQKASIAKYEGIGVRIRGYLKFGRSVADTHPDPNFVGVERQHEESCNCHSDNEAEVDYHITLVNGRGDDFRTAIIVEMSPRIRAKHPTWNLPNLREYARKGVQIRIYGWLIFDGEHKELMFDQTNPDKARVRRATLWEIHPITRLEVKINGVWKIL